MWASVASLPLSTPGAMIVAGVVLGAACLGAVVALRSRRVALAVAALSGVIAPLLFWVGVEKIWRPFPDHIPTQIYVSSGVAIAVIVAGVSVIHAGLCRSVTTALWRGALMVPLAALSVLAALLVANGAYQVYPTVSALDARPSAVTMTLHDAIQRRERSDVPERDGEAIGALVTVSIPSGNDYQPRPARVYLPPAFFRGEELPVLMLMPGSPGAPEQWFTTGQLTSVAHGFQLDHDGRTPLILSVDATGSLSGGPKCVGDVEDYLSRAVPAFARTKLGATPEQSRWTIGGLSYGGTCALQLMTRHPDIFGTVLDYSGEAEPEAGDRSETINTLFHGSEELFREHNPRDILSAERRHPTGRFRGHAARFVAGDKDTQAQQALMPLSHAAADVGVSSEYRTIPGGHTWQVWRSAIAADFDFIAQRGGLT